MFHILIHFIQGTGHRLIGWSELVISKDKKQSKFLLQTSIPMFSWKMDNCTSGDGTNYSP